MPEVISRIHEVLKDDVAGDPCSGAKWTRRSTRKIAEQLQSLGIDVSARKVASLLSELHFSLHVNQKRLSRGSKTTRAERNEQFEYISLQRETFEKDQLPIVSIDTKKKEMVGDFKNAGAKWGKEPDAVLDHDFRSDAEGVAIPSGIYDTQANKGTVFVGVSHNTAEFSVGNLERWWRIEGRQRYPQARKLLVLADGGGSNGSRSRGFKYNLQTRLCDEHGIEVTVCHYPTGASKWNLIEHRLFSQISINWAGQPLRSYETILNYISTTKTKTGLRVTAHLVEDDYPTGVKVSDALMATVNIDRHEVQPQRNYTIRPRA
jgi:hypothetical protein